MLCRSLQYDTWHVCCSSQFGIFPHHTGGRCLTVTIVEVSAWRVLPRLEFWACWAYSNDPPPPSPVELYTKHFISDMIFNLSTSSITTHGVKYRGRREGSSTSTGENHRGRFHEVHPRTTERSICPSVPGNLCIGPAPSTSGHPSNTTQLLSPAPWIRIARVKHHDKDREQIMLTLHYLKYSHHRIHRKKIHIFQSSKNCLCVK